MIFDLKNYIHNREAKNLLGNFIWLSILQAVNYALPLITLPYLARTIGVTGFGKVAFALAVITWFQTFSDWGFNFTATRDVARVRENLGSVSDIFSKVLFARIFLMLIGFIILLILILTIPVFHRNMDVVLISYLLIPGNILCPDWLYQGLERMRFITILNVIAKVVFTIAVFVFIKNEKDYILQPLFTSLGYIIAGLISTYIIIFKWKITIIIPKISEIFTTIKKSTDVFINTFFPNLYNSFSVVILGFWGGSIANGKFDAGNKFVNIIIQIIQVISRTFFPFLSRKVNHHKKFALLSFSITTILSILTFIFAPWLIHLFFTPQFDAAILVTRIMVLSLPFMSLANAYGTNYLIIIGKEKVLRNITAIISITGMIISIPLIYKYSLWGAAITVTFTRTLLGIVIFLKALEIKTKKTETVRES